MAPGQPPRAEGPLRAGWRAAERLLDRAMGARRDPLRHLGAIGVLALWLLGVSGVVLYAVLDTSAAGAWRSIDALGRLPWRLGTLLRGVHRYAADLLALALALHVAREWLHGHARGVHRHPWLTGVPLAGFALASGIGGFWLGWDRLGQFSVIATAEWLDALPLAGAPLARNFLAADAVADRLFSLFVFVHLGVPLLMLLGLWFHLQRLARPAVWPPRPVAAGVGAAIGALALAWPVVSDAPAALDTVPAALRLDWMLLWLHPLAYEASPGAAWALVAGGALVLLALPFLPGLPGRARPPRPAVAVVDAAHCNGCRRCVADCPYAAITLVPHPSRAGRALAQVDADLCAGCGLCAGACPSSTPLRDVERLVTGIDLPKHPLDALRRRLRAAIAASPAPRPLVVFACEHGADPGALAPAATAVATAVAMTAADPSAIETAIETGDSAGDMAGEVAGDVAVVALPCAGQLPPSFVEYALRVGAAGVLVATCPDGGCEFRLGERWTAERLRAAREPRLRRGLPPGRIALAQASAGDEAAVAAALGRLRLRVAREPGHG